MLYTEPHGPKAPPSKRFQDQWLAMVMEAVQGHAARRRWVGAAAAGDGGADRLASIHESSKTAVLSQKACSQAARTRITPAHLGPRAQLFAASSSHHPKPSSLPSEAAPNLSAPGSFPGKARGVPFIRPFPIALLPAACARQSATFPSDLGNIGKDAFRPAFP